MSEIAPGVDGVAWVLRRSTTSGITVAATGQPVGEGSGLHLYILIANGADLPRALEVLCKRLWILGAGWIALSRSGTLLVRQLADAAVGGAERLVFEGAPKLGPGLVQDAASRQPQAHPGIALDSRIALPDLTPAEQAEYERLLTAAKNAIRPAAEKVQAEYIEGEVKKLVSKGADRTKAREAVLSRANGELTETDIIEFSNGSSATVREILDSPKKYHRRACADPHESPHFFLDPRTEHCHNTHREYYNNGVYDGRPEAQGELA